MKKKVLILGVAAVQYDAIVKLQDMGYEVHAIARQADGKGAAAADFFAPVDFSDRSGVVQYIREKQIDAVYSVGSDIAIPISSSLSEELGLPYFVTEETARACNKKTRLRTLLGADFEGNIPFQIMTRKEEEVKLPYPFMLKPSDSQGQRGIHLVHNQEEFLASFDHSQSYSRSSSVILEKFVDGPELSVNGYLRDGELIFCLVSDRETWPQYIGLIHRHLIPAASISKKAVAATKDLLARAAAKLGIQNGPIYGQIKVEGDRPYIIEVTPRLDGCHMWKLIRYSTGIDLLELTFRHLLGDQPDFAALEGGYPVRPYVLRFVCQEPGSRADYSEEEENFRQAEDSFTYYDQGETIRPVNGRYEKIAYLIQPGE